VHLHFRHIVVEGEALRQVICEKCGQSFEYVLNRESAIDTLPFPPLIRQANEICRKRLRRKLAKDIEPVSCPFCGFIQRKMAVELRRRFLKPLGTAGIFGACAALILAIAAASAGICLRGKPGIDIDWFGIAGVALVGVVFGVLLAVCRWFLGRLRYSREGFVANRAIGAGHLVSQDTKAELRRAG
jgi:hypothetical protein